MSCGRRAALKNFLCLGTVVGDGAKGEAGGGKVEPKCFPPVELSIVNLLFILIGLSRFVLSLC